MGRRPQEDPSTPGRSDSAEGPGPHFAIQRLDLRGVTAHKLGEWISRWKTLKQDGWDVTVLITHDNRHSIGMAYKPAARASTGTTPETPAQETEAAPGRQQAREGPNTI